MATTASASSAPARVNNRHAPTNFFNCSNIATMLIVAGFVALFVLAFHFDYLYHDPEFQVLEPATVSVTAFNNSGNDAFLTAKWNMTLVIKNPNTKTSFSFLALHAKLWYKSFYEDLASTRMPPLVQQALNETSVGMQFVSLHQYLNGDMARSIAREEDNGFVEIGVTVFATYKSKDGRQVYSADCHPIIVSLSRNNLTHAFNASSTPCFRSIHLNREGEIQ